MNDSNLDGWLYETEKTNINLNIGRKSVCSAQIHFSTMRNPDSHRDQYLKDYNVSGRRCAKHEKGLFQQLFICLLISFPSLTFAADLSPNYQESVQLAIDHAASPASWQAPSLFVIPDGGGTYGLTYDGANLIVRTATKSGNFTSQYVGKSGYTIYGDPQKDATWVTTGNDATRFLLANGVTGANVTKLIERGLGMDTAGTHDASSSLPLYRQMTT